MLFSYLVISSITFLFQCHAINPINNEKVNFIRHPSSIINGPFEYYRTLQKYSPQPNSIATNRKDHFVRRQTQFGQEAANLRPDEGGYTSPVTVGQGSTSKTFFVELDTASSAFWLMSTFLGLQNLSKTND